MSNATIGLHGVVQVKATRWVLPSGNHGPELSIVDRDGATTTLYLFTGTETLQIAGLENEEVPA